jgi:hypothetical protein
MQSKYLSFAFIVLSIFWGCQNSQKAVQITGWEEYKNPYFKVHFSHPQGWFINAETSRVRIYSTPESVDKFLTPTSDGKQGVQFNVAFEKIESLKSLDQYLVDYQNEFTASGLALKTEKKLIDSTDAVQFEYTEVFGKNAKITTIETMAIKDTILYTIGFKAFGDLAISYRSAYDVFLSSIQLPEPMEKQADPSLPSTEFAVYSNDYLSISYPDNFSPSILPLEGEYKFSLELKGYRQDSDIRIDVLPAKGLVLEKVIEQNISNFPKAGGPVETMIDGTKTLLVNYSPAKNIASRVYFIVKNDHVYRIIFNYYLPMKNNFLPAFEKTVASLNLKIQ